MEQALSSLNPVRLGLVGNGRAGSMHRCEIRPHADKFTYVAVCDCLPDRIHSMQKQYDGCKGYTRYEDLLADEAVEVVDIATRSVDHLRHAAMALAADKIVFLEKPMTCSYCEALKLQDLAAAAPGKLYIRHNRRFEAGFQHIREIIASGILGEVFKVKLHRDGYQRRDDWQTIKEYGGGQLLNWGPHLIDHALRFLESPVKRQWSNLQKVAAAGDAEDHVHILLEGDNGRIVEVGITGGAAIAEPEYLIWGRQGALTCSGDTIRIRYLDPTCLPAPREANPDTPQTSTFGGAEALPWIDTTMTVSPEMGCDVKNTIWEALYETVRHGVEFPITLDEAVGVMAVISAAREGTTFEHK